MKHLTITLALMITLASCKKTPDRIVIEHPTPEPVPCNVTFYTATAYGNLTLTVNDAKFITVEVGKDANCDKGFKYQSFVGRQLTYSYKMDASSNSGTLILVQGCNLIELK